MKLKIDTITENYAIIADGNLLPGDRYLERDNISAGENYLQDHTDAKVYCVREVVQLSLVEGNPPPPVIVPVPTDVSAIATSGTSVHVTWNGSAPDGVYDIYRNGQKITDTSAHPRTYFDDTGIFSGTYSYAVVAIDQQGNQSDMSAAAVVVVLGLPINRSIIPPSNLQTTPTSSSAIKLTWQTASGPKAISNYIVFRDKIRVALTIVPSFSDAGLAPGTYRYSVVAIDQDGGASAMSLEAVVSISGS